jgi:hypothetical protein
MGKEEGERKRRRAGWKEEGERKRRRAGWKEEGGRRDETYGLRRLRLSLDHLQNLRNSTNDGCQPR